MREPHSFANRPPRRNAFDGVCRCGMLVPRKEGWVWKGGVYCRFPTVPYVCEARRGME